MNEQERVGNELLKKLPVVIGILIGIVIITAIGVDEFKHGKLVERARKYDAFEGIVVEKRCNRHKSAPSQITIELGIRSSYATKKEYSVPIINDSVFKMIEPGDLLIKRPNEVVCSLVKNFDTIIFDPVTGICGYRIFFHKL